jgi:hypothetical protein
MKIKRSLKKFYWYVILIMLVSVLIGSVPVLAKGGASLIRVINPESGEMTEITEEKLLERFNPWAGYFIGTGGPLEYAPNVGQYIPYQVFLYFDDGFSGLDLAYMFYYYPDPNPDLEGSRGYIYLPGDGDPYHRVNTRTIIREDSDGRWHYASPILQDLIPEVDSVIIDTDEPVWDVLSRSVFQPIASWISSQFDR